MELLIALLATLALVGAFAAQFGADSRPSEHDGDRTASWTDLDRSHHA